MKYLKYDVFNFGILMYLVKMIIVFILWLMYSFYKFIFVFWRGICVRIKVLGFENDYKIKIMWLSVLVFVKDIVDIC